MTNPRAHASPRPSPGDPVPVWAPDTRHFRHMAGGALALSNPPQPGRTLSAAWCTGPAETGAVVV